MMIQKRIVLQVQWTPSLFDESELDFSMLVKNQQNNLKETFGLDVFHSEKINGTMVFTVHRLKQEF
jgi:hypothetical protein